LTAAALRMLGSTGEAEDAVQEAWIRLTRSDAASIANLEGWLTTVVTRVCLDLLRRRKVRAEEVLEDWTAASEGANPGTRDPEAEAILADSVEQALLIVLDRLAPAERVAFVLHDLFDIQFSEIALILERSEESVRQLSSRARRRVQIAKDQTTSGARSNSDLVKAFFAASKRGNLSELMGLLAPSVVLRADATAVLMSAANQAQGAPRLEAEILGPKAVAESLRGKAEGVNLVWIDGEPGAAWIVDGKTRAAFTIGIGGGKIREILIQMDPGALKAKTITAMAL